MTTLGDADLEAIDAQWRAANYLSVGQIYLRDNPLLRRPLAADDIKPRLLGHWGTSPGLNLVYAHLNRVIHQRDVDAIFVTGPGHGGPALLANTYLEGTYTETYPDVTADAEGMRRLFAQFSVPGGMPSHAAPETPGSINEGGELGYSLAHAYGAAFDAPDLVAVCVVGDGEFETGPLAASWHSNMFLDPVTDGAVLPVLHLNGYKIANPTIPARIGEDDLRSLMRGYGYEPIVVSGDDPARVHRALAAALDDSFDRIEAIRSRARSAPDRSSRPRWPMIILRTPKGWTGPERVDGNRVEGTFRAHQVPLGGVRDDESHRRQLEAWLRSYEPEALFDEDGAPRHSVTRFVPEGRRRMGANPQANGGVLRRSLDLPDFRDHAVEMQSPGHDTAEATRALGEYLRDLVVRNRTSFRLFGPDEVDSNRLSAVFDVTDRAWQAGIEPDDEHLAPGGRVMEVLSEHLCQGWLEGYLLTGRHGLLTSYEAFAHIVDSMVNQHAKWLESARAVSWRRPIASLNYLLTSHVWRQDHNGFSHQDPGFIDNIMNKKPELVRVYLPPDVNSLLVTADHCLRTTDCINVIVAGKQPALTYLDIDAAQAHAERGISVWDWAGHGTGEPDVVLAAAGEIPTQEMIAAAALLRQEEPELTVRVVNVIDMMRLQSPSQHPHGMSDRDFDDIFTDSAPIVFAYHGYPWLIHRLTYRRRGHDQLHVHGYREEGTTTTPFDMVMRNGVDRFTLAMDAVDRAPKARARAAVVKQRFARSRLKARRYAYAHGVDDPEISDWTWPW